MSDNKSQKIAEKLALLQSHFHKELPDRINLITKQWDRFSQSQYKDQDALSRLHNKAHSLAGTAGTFGAIAVGNASRELEILLKASMESGNPLTDGYAIQISTQLNELQTITQNWQPSGIPHISEDSSTEKSFNNLVYLVEDDELLASQLISELEDKKYTVKHFTDSSTIITSCKQQKPAIIIMDMVLIDGDTAGAEITQKIRTEIDHHIPVIFISVRDDIHARLAAARAGANRYLTKPLNIPKLIQTVDGITVHKPKDPYRILIIDDEQSLLDYYSTVLTEADMLVKSVIDPLQGLTAITEFNPDLIILDVYMSGCSGPELAQVIRQDDAYARTPIIFLSTESNLDRQLAAMNLGGDDFLTKPIEAHHLVMAITARVSRARWTSRLNQELESTLRESEYRKIALDQHAIVSIANATGDITFINKKFIDISGYKENELIGKNHRILKSKQHDKKFYEDLWETINKGNVWHGLICNLTKQGEEFWVESTIVPFLDAYGKPYQYVSARTDVTDHILTEEKLRLAKEEAEDANRAKSQFLSSMSHELRTPMNAILGFSQLLQMQKKPALSTAQGEHVNEIMKASHHLLNLINEILDLSKIEAGRIDLSIEAVAINNVIEECLALSAPLAERRSISMPTDCKCYPYNYQVRADRTRLKQVLLNLLSNAIKYNSENGSINIDCEQVNDFIRINVSDTGSGISEKNLNHLFQAFNRLTAENTEIEGTGIGLVITKNIVELMGGKIGVHSVKGKGSTFWIELPQDTSIIHDLINDIDSTSTYNPRTPGQHDHVILYIEDNPTNLKLVAQVLGRRSDINLLSAHEPFLGLELAAARKPDLILLDINLPGIDGYQVLKKLNQNEETKDIPVYAISANAMPNDIKKGKDAGFTKYLTKPININELLDAVDAAFS
ncbi:MAG: response regulator [Gammaproteobacteria bacterium]|nr:response regulator [Gammaproteobacteria bacterium]MCW9006180.1 response regulator [Gammaproteobacteria bacterium]